MPDSRFRFSTDILQRLGEELVTSVDQGVIELAKNAYDADARRCTVELNEASNNGATIIVEDDGDGMTSEDIRDGWLVIGRSRKDPSKRTRLKRLPAGSKGLGRLAALRLGEEVILTTRPRSAPSTELSLRIRWSDFASTDVVENVPLSITSRRVRGKKSSTRIEIRGVRRPITKREVRQLGRELVLLADPFGHPSGFSAQLVSPEFEEIERLVSQAYFDDCELRLRAELDSQGRATAKVFDRSGKLKWETTDGDLDEHFEAPAADFELWVFLLQGKSFAGSASTLGEVRRWLGAVGGVHLYQRGLRVRPYGDPGNDWLGMNLSRSRDPELRPSTNTSIGRAVVLDEDQELVPKTDRTGFIETQAFTELRRFATEALEWMQSQRLSEREERKRLEKERTRREVGRASRNVDEAVRVVPRQARVKLEKAVADLQRAQSKERVAIQEELGLYKTLASVGTAVSVFAHEIEGPASDLTTGTRNLERRARDALKGRYQRVLGAQVESVLHSAERLARFATLPLGMLKRSKRRPTLVDVDASVLETIELFRLYLDDAKIDVDLQLHAGNAQVSGTVASVEAIVSNLLTNSVKAFKRRDSRLTDRTLLVRTAATESQVVIAVMDNGPGILYTPVDRIWLPGVTSDDETGVGLGLAIVRDTVADLGGEAVATARGELGGAEFTVSLPRARAG